MIMSAHSKLPLVTRRLIAHSHKTLHKSGHAISSAWCPWATQLYNPATKYFLVHSHCASIKFQNAT